MQCGRPGFSPWVGRISWRREQLPTRVFWPGELHGLFHGVARRRTQLSDFHSHSHSHFDIFCKNHHHSEKCLVFHLLILSCAGNCVWLSQSLIRYAPLLLSNSMDINLRKLWETVEDRGAWNQLSLGSQRVRHDLATEQQHSYYSFFILFIRSSSIRNMTKCIIFLTQPLEVEESIW